MQSLVVSTVRLVCLGRFLYLRFLHLRKFTIQFIPMLKSMQRIAVRHLRKRKGYAVLNIFGLGQALKAATANPVRALRGE